MMKRQGKLFVNRRDNLLVKLSIAGLCVVLLVLLLNVFSSQARNTFYSLSYPLQKNFWSAGIASSDFVQSIIHAPVLLGENRELEEEKQKLLLQIAILKSQQSADQAYQSAQAVAQNSRFKMAMVSVIGLDADDIISIDKGGDDGIKQGMPVINKENNLVGRVSVVYKNFSQVMLISNKNSVVNVKVQQGTNQESEIDGVVKGGGKMSLHLDLIPIDQKISEGDALVTSSLDSFVPKDILVGTIASIKKNDQEPHQSAVVKPFFNISESNLFVITDYKLKD